MPLFKVIVSEQVVRRSVWVVRAADEDDAEARYHAGQRALASEEDVDVIDVDVEGVEDAEGNEVDADELSLLPTEEGLTAINEGCDLTHSELGSLCDAAEAGDSRARLLAEAQFGRHSHAPLCPHRVGGECLCVVARLSDLFDGGD